MTYPKMLVVVAIAVFGAIGMVAIVKRSFAPQQRQPVPYALTYVSIPEVQAGDIRPAPKQRASLPDTQHATKEAAPKSSPAKIQNVILTQKKDLPASPVMAASELISHAEDNIPVTAKHFEALPEADRIGELFNKGEPKLPFVETVTYKSSVPWLKGKPAWLGDYANYYNTSCHFIARSLNGKPDYLRQNVANGDRFNVFRKDRNISFYLLVDLSQLKMLLYAVDEDVGERTLLKSYRAGLGRPDDSKKSGFLTPIGKYTLGNKIATYQPKVEGFYKGTKVEMVRVFGTRWIPFDKEISNCSEPAKGFGIHGVPWLPGKDGVLQEDKESIGKYESDGCIRLGDADVKEIFSIIVTKPTTIEIVRHFSEAKLPGSEISLNK